MTAWQLAKIAKQISGKIVTHCSDIPNVLLTQNNINILIKLFPVIYFVSKDTNCFLNLHELVYTPGALEYLLLNPASMDDAKDHLEKERPDQQNDQGKVDRKGIGGQPSIVSKFPGIIDEVAEFIKQHGFSAQSRRRTETGYSSGVSISQIRDHLYLKFPELEKHTESLTTIGRMFQAPNKGFRSSERYKGYIDARVGTKANSYREPHPDAHYLFACNKMRRELASLFNDEISVISIDDMAKVKVGAPAVSRYHQLQRIFPTNDPVSGYLLNVSGHMFLQSKDHKQVDQQNKTADTLDDLQTASLYDSEKPASQHNFDSMIASGNSINPFDCISQQIHFHLNITSTPQECLDAIKFEINQNKDYYKKSYNGDLDALCSNLSLYETNAEHIDVILQATASCFSCKIVLFYTNDEQIAFREVKCRGNIIESPIYIQQLDKTPVQFASLLFKKESVVQ